MYQIAINTIRAAVRLRKTFKQMRLATAQRVSCRPPRLKDLPADASLMAVHYNMIWWVYRLTRSWQQAFVLKQLLPGASISN